MHHCNAAVLIFIFVTKATAGSNYVYTRSARGSLRPVVNFSIKCLLLDPPVSPVCPMPVIRIVLIRLRGTGDLHNGEPRPP